MTKYFLFTIIITSLVIFSCCKVVNPNLSNIQGNLIPRTKLDSLIVKHLSQKDLSLLKTADQYFAFELNPFEVQNDSTIQFENIVVTNGPIEMAKQEGANLKTILLSPENYILDDSKKLCLPTPRFGIQMIQKLDTLNVLVDPRCNELEFRSNGRFFSEDTNSGSEAIAQIMNKLFNK